MRIIVHPHALSHGLTVEQIRQAYESGEGGATIRDRDDDTEPQRWATIGFDEQGRAIELVFVVLMGGDVLVFHANYLTKGFLAEMRKAERK